LGSFDDRSADAYDQAIKNVDLLGADKAPKHDVKMAKRAAQQAGSVGRQARAALGKKR